MVARNNGLGGPGSFLGAWISTPCLIFTARIVFALFTIHQALRLHPFLGLTLGAILVGLLTFTVPELTLANGFWKDKAR